MERRLTILETDLNKYLAIDIETSDGAGQGSLNEYDENSYIALIQIREHNGPIELLHWNEETESRLKDYINKGYTFILHNAMFDASWFLRKHGLFLPKIWDTQIVSQLLNAGKVIPDEATHAMQRVGEKNLEYLGNWEPIFFEQDENLSVKKGMSQFSHSLQATVKRYAGATLQKDQGNTDWSAELTEEQRRYAEDDVKYLHEVVKNQLHFLEKHGLERVAELELSLVPVLVKMKHDGIFINQEDWRKAAAEYLEEARKLESELNEEMGLELARRQGSTTLWGTPTPLAFSVSSPAQLASFFGTEKADEASLRYVEHPTIPRIMKFKELFKLATTYGEGYFRFIHPDGRIHAGLNQAATATGRISSNSPNLQNLPRNLYKKIIAAPKGRVLVWFDYSSVESRILAIVSKDQGYLEVVNSTDIHWNTAKSVYHLPEDAQRYELGPDGTPDESKPIYYNYNGEEVSSDDLRNKAKGSVFGIAYGISAAGLVSRELAADLEEGQKFLDSFSSSYPTLMKYLNHQAADAVHRGYTQDPVGRIRWYEVNKRLSQEEQDSQRRGFARQAFNFSIQSTSASITKRAMIKVHEYLSRTGAGQMALTIHDSIAVELYEDSGMLKEAAFEIKRLMEEAGQEILPAPEGVSYPVDIEVFDPKWVNELR